MTRVIKKKAAIILTVGIIVILIVFSLNALLSNTEVSPTKNIDSQPGSLPTASPVPTRSPTPTDKPTPTPTATQTPTVAPSSAPTPTSPPTPTPTSTPTTTPSPTPSPTQTPTPTPTPSPSPSPTPTATPVPTPIPTPSPLPTPNPATIIFSDDFQSGNTSAWTNIDSSGVNLGVKNSILECSTDGATAANWGYVYKWLNQTYTSLDWRWYVYFGNLPTTDGNIVGAGGIYNSAIEGNFTSANIVTSLSVVRQNGANYWRLDFVNNTTIYSLNSTSTVLPNTWYLVELNAVEGAGNGEVHLFLNDAETLNATGLTNNLNSGIDHVSVGGGITADQAITWYCASAVASTEHVGPEPSVAPGLFSLNSQAAGAGLILSDLMAGSLLCAAFLATGMLKAKTMQNLTRTGNRQEPKKIRAPP